MLRSASLPAPAHAWRSSAATLLPPVVNDRLSLTADGRVVYRFKRTFRDDSSHVVTDPLTFIERLAALVPRPFVRLVTYHDLFAPDAPLRDCVVVPRPPTMPRSRRRLD